MRPNSTTTTPGKVAKPKKTGPAAASRHRLLPWPRTELGEVVQELTGEEHDLGYLSDLVRKHRKNERLRPTIEKAVEILNERHRVGK